MRTAPLHIDDVEQWNDTFAVENDIDDYYERSGVAIRFVERRRLRIIKRMIDAATPVEGRPRDILEVGCGGGHVLRLFDNARLTGVDVSGVFLEKARRNLARRDATLLKGEVDTVGLSQNQFTHIICTEVLEHVVDPDRVLAGIQRVAADGATIVVTFPNDTLINRAKAVIRASGAGYLPTFRRVSWGGDKYHLHVWTVPRMRELLSNYFTVTQEAFAPFAALPFRCCFSCVNNKK
jgi:ubiquinone/menaquinone biosynthesis C-methylase UbiE